MKKRYWYLSLSIIAIVFITAIAVLVAILSKQEQRDLLPPHEILSINGLDLEWKLEKIYTPGFRPLNPNMIVKRGKIFFQGMVDKGDLTQITILDASNGGFLANTKPTSYDTQFATDGVSLYIGVGNKGNVYRYDYETKKVVWSNNLGNVIGPCCFNILNGELQMSWQKNHFYQTSLRDGSIQFEFPESRVFHYENGVFIQGVGDVLLAKNMEGIRIWRQNFGIPIQQQPVFYNGKIFLNANSSPEGIVYVLDQTTGKILWNTEYLVIGNIALSADRVYFLRYDGVLLGVNQNSGQIEIQAQLSSEGEFYNYGRYTKFNTDFQVTFDQETNTLFLLTGDSGQLFAFHETR